MFGKLKKCVTARKISCEVYSIVSLVVVSLSAMNGAVRIHQSKEALFKTKTIRTVFVNMITIFYVEKTSYFQFLNETMKTIVRNSTI